MERKDGKIRVVTLQGNLTIQKANQLAEELRGAVDQSDHVVLDIGMAEGIDLSCLQVIYAAKKTADMKGGKLVFRGTISPEIGETLTLGGFCKEAPVDGSELDGSLFDFGMPAKSGD